MTVDLCTTVNISTTMCRKLQKEKRKEQHRQRVEFGVDLGLTRKAMKRNTMANSRCRIAVAVDLSFDDLMSDKVSLLSPIFVEYFLWLVQ